MIIDHNDMCSTPPGKILPPQLGVPPSFFEIFSTTQLGKFQKSSTPPAKVGGVQTMYISPFASQKHVAFVLLTWKAHGFYLLYYFKPLFECLRVPPFSFCCDAFLVSIP